jgi:hypothetical protein
VDWLAAAGENGWLVLTKDDHIRFRDNEKAAVHAAKVRLFALTRGNMSGDDMASAFVKALPRMKRLARRQAPPFVATVSAAGDVTLKLK